MSKELEALNNLTQLAFNYAELDEQILSNAKKYHDIIEDALKRLETLEEDFMSLTETNMELVQVQARNQKKLKALKIIKEKRVNVCLLLVSDFKMYNQWADITPLTQEEFDFLKEVLLYE